MLDRRCTLRIWVLAGCRSSILGSSLCITWLLSSNVGWCPTGRSIMSGPGVPECGRTSRPTRTDGYDLTLCPPPPYGLFRILLTVDGGLSVLTPRGSIRSCVGPGCPSFAGLIGSQLVKTPLTMKLVDCDLALWLFTFSPLDGHMLFDAVSGKYASAGGLDGWNWREFATTATTSVAILAQAILAQGV